MKNHIEKHGIVLIGSSIVDELLPPVIPGQLLYVDAARFVPATELVGEKVQYSVGGMALNVAVNLAKIGGGYPIAVVGKVGADHRAELIRTTLQQHGVCASALQTDTSEATSWTQVIHIRMPDGNIERLFRHALGAMGSFTERDVPLEVVSSYRIAMVGYGLLLPQLDLNDSAYGTRLGRLLAAFQDRGLMTAIDFVSPNPENQFKFQRYRKTLPFVDVCCINEDQACSLTTLLDPRTACIALVEQLGARIAVVHCGASGPNYGYSKECGLVVQPNFAVSVSEYRGNAGAGDAFAAGLLHGLHQNWELFHALKFAAGAAAISLRDMSCTGAMQSESFILRYISQAMES